MPPSIPPPAVVAAKEGGALPAAEGECRERLRRAGGRPGGTPDIVGGSGGAVPSAPASGRKPAGKAAAAEDSSNDGPEFVDAKNEDGIYMVPLGMGRV